MSIMRYSIVFLAGMVASVLAIGFVADNITESTVKNCEKMGQFRFKEQVITCNLEKP